MITWSQFILEQTKHEFSSTQVNLPTSVGVKVIRFGKVLIAQEDVYEKEGRETQPHVTVLFGLHANTPDQVKKILKNESSIELTLGSTSVFECDEYDVVKLTVISEDLKRLNKLLTKRCEHTQTHPSYVPHCTLAYVKKGTGVKYARNKTLKNTKVKIDKLIFSNKNRIHTTIHLDGEN